MGVHAHMHTHTFYFTAGAFSSAVGAFHPNHRAERPFPEEEPGSDGDGFLKQVLPPPSQLEGLKHFLHQVREGLPIPPYFLLPFLIFSFYSRSPGLWLQLPFRSNTLS